MRSLICVPLSKSSFAMLIFYLACELVTMPQFIRAQDKFFFKTTMLYHAGITKNIPGLFAPVGAYQ